MRRFYVAPHDVWHANIDNFHPQIGSHCLHLIDYTSQDNAELMHKDPAAWEALPEVKAWRAKGSPLLISTSVEHSEWCEDQWHGHPDVAVLPHPTFEGTDPMSKHIGSATKKIKQEHLDHLSVLGVKPNHTVWDIHDLASKRMPNCKLRAVL